ncbi:complex III assembly factor LYRM7-like [Mytilus californianus]|uniref:complex III assembly factor LYRM7-like n=1 Tax=Mytilus californianus TaxID=6549 RepID=UPI0022473837|nr:complex III assembly factor LYRM7-like [Mytilus californianus]
MSIRSKVLSSFKKLHKTRLEVFREDDRALAVARDKINSEFKKNKDEKDTEKISELIQIAEDSEDILRRNVVQGIVREDDKALRLRIRKDVLRSEPMYSPKVKYEVPQNKKPNSSDNPS